MESSVPCWCGDDARDTFGRGYVACPGCGTLCRLERPQEAALARVTDDEQGYYGRRYWEEHQRELGHAPLADRSVSDLLDRCPDWLGLVLAYRRPPARVVEIGAGHGGLVALLRAAGYDATGTELSPWVVAQARARSGVTLLRGPVEQAPVEPGSVDVLCAFDVLEHLPRPLETLERALRWLAPDGILVLQTPRRPDGASLAELEGDDAPFLSTLIDEHLHLFDSAALRRLCTRLGLTELVHEAPRFPTDQVVVASRGPLRRGSPGEVRAALEGRGEARAALALVEQTDRLRRLEADFAVADDDRVGRLARIEELEARLARERDEHRRAIEELRAERERGPGSALDLDRLPDVPVQVVEVWRLPGPGPGRSQPRGTIAVDLTALRPGGENGGAKIVSTTLVRALARRRAARRAGDADGAPGPSWLLLCTPECHPELRELETEGVRTLAMPPSQEAHDERVVPEAPELLFCPMTAPPFHQPWTPLVSLVHDLQSLDHPENFSEAERQARALAIARVREDAARVVVLTETVRRSVLAHTELAPGDVEVIRFAAAARLRRPPASETEAVLERHDLRPGAFAIYPANAWVHKNHELLLTAYALHRRGGGRWPLVLTAAAVPDARPLRRAAERLGLADAVRFPGYLPEAELAAMLAGAGALVFPSLYEGFGMPVVEAMALGVPVLAGDRTSLPEVAGDAALLVDPRDPAALAGALGRLERDADLRAELVRKGTERAAAFADDEAMADRLLAVFEDVLSTPALHGRFPDGWLSERLVVTRPPARAGWLELDLENPRPEPVTLVGEAPDPRLRVVVEAGSRRTLHCRLGEGLSRVAFRVTPLFRPVDRGLGDDVRWLGLRLGGARLGTVDDDRGIDLVEAGVRDRVRPGEGAGRG